MAKGNTINAAKDLLETYCYGHPASKKRWYYSIVLAMGFSRCAPWMQILLVCFARHTAAEM